MEISSCYIYDSMNFYIHQGYRRREEQGTDENQTKPKPKKKTHQRLGTERAATIKSSVVRWAGLVIRSMGRGEDIYQSISLVFMDLFFHLGGKPERAHRPRITIVTVIRLWALSVSELNQIQTLGSN